ncbi:MAG: hypothetical protein WCT20_05430 [Candidatus Babeliales bacterium]
MFIPLIIFIASATLGAPTTLAESTTVGLAQNPESIGEYVEKYFSETPILADIARCESTMRHTDKDGTILRGEVDSDDIGVMQINTRYHLEDSKELGLDIYSLNGNLAYAQHLYKTQGVQPWRASQPCWGKIASR